jgi:pimeloyl-ACP methyl ester carboxylesterase
LKPLLKGWFLADGSWKDRPPETKRGKGLELWEMSIGMSAEFDRILYEGDTFSQSFRRTLQESFSQGAQGYARDLVNALSSWPMKLEEITIPVDLWYGGLDTSTVHSPDFGATLALRLPNVSRTFEPNEGGVDSLD